mgnify:CR=1 FL=1
MQHYKALFTLGIPIVIGQIGVIILGFADTLMIGHHSTNELAAASFVNNMFTLAKTPGMERYRQALARYFRQQHVQYTWIYPGIWKKTENY